jgi:hypothetical protein
MTAKQLADAVQQLPGAPVRPGEEPGIEAARLSIIHSNLGLALQSRGQLARAQEQYKRAIEMDSSQVQTLSLRVMNARGPVGFRSLMNAVQSKLRGVTQVLGRDQPVGCHIAVGDDSTITISIIRASLWDQMTQAALITDVGFLQVLRDQVLTGEFEAGLEKGIQQKNGAQQRAEKETNREAKEEQDDEEDGMEQVEEDGVELERLSSSSSSKSPSSPPPPPPPPPPPRSSSSAKFSSGPSSVSSIKITVNKKRFAEMYERNMLMLKSLTPHQADVLKKCWREVDGKLIMEFDVHIRASAGAGKTFVALHISVRYLEDVSAHILFVAQNEALAYFVAKWLYTRTQDQSILSRFHVLYGAELKRGRFIVDADTGRLLLEEIDASERVEYILLVVDEAHQVFSTFPADFADRYISTPSDNSSTATTRRLLLSDISQSDSLTDQFAAAGISGTKEGVLTQVVRSTERIVVGAAAFQTNDADAGSTCHHKASGPPLKALLFPPQLDNRSRMEQYAREVRNAMHDLKKQFEGMDFPDRVAIIVPDTEFIEAFKPLLQLVLGEDYEFVDAAEANRCIPTSGGASVVAKSKQCLVLDTADNFNGLERLIVIATGLDSPTGKDAAGKARSQLYRAITRAQMMVAVVNEVLPGGWLEFLPCVDFDSSKQFDVNEESKQNVRGAALAILEGAKQDATVMGLEAQDADQEMDPTDAEKDPKQKIEDMTGVRKPAKQTSKKEAKRDLDKKSRREVPETGVADQQGNRVQSTVWDTSGVEASEGVTPAFMPLQTVNGAEVKEVGVVIIYCWGNLLKAGPSTPLMCTRVCSLIFTFFHICSSRSGRFCPSFETAPGLPTGNPTSAAGTHWRSTTTRADAEGSRWRAETSPKSI